MKNRSYKFEWIILLLALFVVIFSAIGDHFSESFNWFARSGAIIVLLGVIVEYRISPHIYEDLQRAQFQQSIIKIPIPLKAEPTKQRKYISVAAHTIVVFGTILWGYGDLVWH